MKKKNSIAWAKVSSQTSSYIIDVISWVLILASSMTMISQVFLEIKIEDKYVIIMMILLAGIIALYRLSFSCLFLPFITTSIAVFIYINNSVKVEDAFLFPLNVYLKKFEIKTYLLFNFFFFDLSCVKGKPHFDFFTIKNIISPYYFT